MKVIETRKYINLFYRGYKITINTNITDMGYCYYTVLVDNQFVCNCDSQDEANAEIAAILSRKVSFLDD